jgi:hypothetical protein
MAHSLISKRLLEVISNRHAENAKRPGKPPFPDFQGHFHGNGDDLDWWKSPAARWRVEPNSDEAPAVVSHPFEPTLSLPIDLSATVSMAWHLRATSEPALVQRAADRSGERSMRHHRGQCCPSSLALKISLRR